ncbi:hypothetical protein J3L16_00950 [Alteromonas sp. 5E99-2]|uniref:hypothetical protein n=1 Tax=Alteromonas sp. 5E99-2 TaxID=2817683 RepID=UPI001A981556|nr:hypothetical protein [Alteromonas sp. 5E99-2]MBO1254246.1 hypothetical protein [Alteromonas sp. 5E99-2]
MLNLYVNKIMTPLHGIQFLAHSNDKIENNLPFSIELHQHSTPLKVDSGPIWSLHDQGERYSTLVNLYECNDKHVLDIACEGKGQFVFDESSLSIFWQKDGTSFEHYLQTFGASLFLELNGVPCIHANALEKGGEAILLIAPSRMGKSSLSAALVSTGYTLLTDDMAALYHNRDLGFHTYPSWSKLRLWPDSTESMLSNIDVQSTKSVHSRFSKTEVMVHSKVDPNQAVKIKGAYLLNRIQSDDTSYETSIEPIAPSNAAIITMQNSMLADAYRALGQEIKRLALIAKYIETIPFYQVNYKSGFDIINTVAEKISAHSAGPK